MASFLLALSPLPLRPLVKQAAMLEMPTGQGTEGGRPLATASEEGRLLVRPPVGN